MSLQRDIRTGIRYGLKAWIAYAVAEFCFLSLLPRIMLSHWVLTPLHLRLTAVLFAGYLVLGALAGVVCGLAVWLAGRYSARLRAIPAATRFDAAASLTVLAVFAAGLLRVRPATDIVWEALALCALLAGLVGMAAAWRRQAAALAGPWVVSLALVGVFWLAKDLPGQDSRSVRLAVAGLYFLTLLAAAMLLPRLKLPVPAARLRGLPRHAIVPILVAALSIALGTGRAGGGSPVPPARPNVVLIVLDTVRADHLSVYGYGRDTTPNLRKFASQSTRYANAISASDMTLASHASIFTGLYPSEHGAHYAFPDHPWGRPLDRRFHTMAEILRENGYSTMGVVANYAYAGRFVNLDQGFDSYDDPAPIPVLDWNRQYFVRQTIRGILTDFFSTSVFDAEYRRADEITPSVMASLAEARRRSKPFFLFVNYMDAHWPYIPPAPYDRRYPGKDERLTTPVYYQAIHDVLAGRRSLTGHERRHLISQYDGAIAYLDSQLGRVIGRLKELGLYNNSLIVVTADHGEAFGERATLGHLVSVYQEEIHVPLLIKFPGSREGRVVNDWVSGVDLLPTVLDVAGLPIPPGLDGKSLRQLRPGEQRTLISESFPNPLYRTLDPARFDRVERAVFSGGLKLVSSTRGQRELYDLSRDPGETTNLCSADFTACATLEAGLQRWLKSAVREQRASRSLSREAIERLRSLGYVQ